MKLVFISLLFTTCYCSLDLPSNWPRCKAGDTECLPKVITKVIRLSKNGIPQLDFPRLDPLHFNKITASQGNGPVKINLVFSDLDLYGISNSVITKVVGFELDPRKSKFEVQTKVPSLTFNGRYNMNGNVLVLPVQGKGLMNLTLDNVDLNFKLKQKVITKDNEEYLLVDKLKLDVNITRLYMNFDNLFNGNQLLSQTTNQFLNDNWMEIYKEMKAPVVKAIKDAIVNLMNSLFRKVPYKKVFLSN